jgi:hypothetical protein
MHFSNIRMKFQSDPSVRNREGHYFLISRILWWDFNYTQVTVCVYCISQITNIFTFGLISFREAC